MSTDIKDGFNKLNINITNKQISQVLDTVIAWETRKEHPLVLHSLLIGVYTVTFLPMDRDNLFHIFGLEAKDIADLIKQMPSVNSNFNVMSDPFNMFVIWLIHLAENQIKNKRTQTEFKVALLKYLSYKLFSGRERVYFPHKVDEGVMTATMMDLSKKYNLVKYGSWYNVLLDKVEYFLSPKYKQGTVFLTGTPDSDFTYVIIDLYNRINSNIKHVANEFHIHYKAGDGMKSVSGTMTDAEGEKVLVERSSTIQMVDSRLSRDILNVNAWVNSAIIARVGSQFPSINNNHLKKALTMMSSLATSQYNTKGFDPHQMVNGEKLVVGVIHLVKLIVTTSAAIAFREGVVLSNSVVAWKTLKDVFSASRTLDPDVHLIKASVAKFVDDTAIVSREATKISLRMAIIMFVVYRFILLAK